MDKKGYSRQVILNKKDKEYILYLRSVAILVVVFGHVGGFWIFRPYSEFLHVVIPIFFFLSGVVNHYSYKKTGSLTSYYFKRFSRLLIPYYLLCGLSLTVYISIYHTFPVFNFEKLSQWLLIRPGNNIMVFPVGHVWFIQTLFFILLFSPVYFYLKKVRMGLLVLTLISIIMLASLQVWIDISNRFYIFNNNLYLAVFHSFFFIIGINYSDEYIKKNPLNIFLIAACCLLIAVTLIFYFKVDVDLGNHTFKPDIYYLSVSLFHIIVFLVLKDKIVHMINSRILIKKMLFFINDHIFAVYLLHTFAIYLSEIFFGFATPWGNKILYGICKFSIVLIITCILASPFTRLSQYLTISLVRFLHVRTP